ncbi:uncharacterized protein [Lolium perenne]|uniref:uncharacterized protein isoform X2 n=1 Tax=Lolium perenne TaxID=4522 RepID=UPI0021F66991|nr:uncharacterized protein LOC127341906 isoform X2 [Lolium perenne]
MPRSTRRRSRKHGREERDRSDSDEDPRPREKGSAREHEKRLSSAASAKLPNAGEASGSSAEGRKKRKSRGEQEADTREERRSGGGEDERKRRKSRGEQEDDTREERREDERVNHRDSKKSRSSDGDVKGKSARNSDRSDEVSRRKSSKGALLEEDGAGEHRRVKERGVEREAEKSKESKQVMVLKGDDIDQQYKMVKDRSRDHDKGDEGRHDASFKDIPRNKEVKTRDLDSDKSRSKCNGTDDRQREDELHDGELEKNGRHRKTKDLSVGKDESHGGSRERQTRPRDVCTKVDGYYEQQHTDEKFKDDMPRGVDKPREEKYKDDRSKVQDRYKNNKYKDDRYKEEERHSRDDRYKEEERHSRDERYKEEERHSRDERYREERSRHEDRHKDVKYKEERSKEEGRHKDERYKEKPRDEEKPRNERSDNSSREKHRDDIYRNSRNQDGGSRGVRSSKDNTRDRSLEKHHKDELNYSDSRYNKNRLNDNEENASAADHRSTKYRDDSKVKKRSYEENGDLEPRNAKEYHGDATTKHRSDVGSFLSSEDRRREYEKVDSRKRDFERKSPSRSSTYHVKEQSRHFPKQEESSPREYGAALGRQRRTSDFQSVDGLNITDANSKESSHLSKDGRILRSDGRPIHFNDRPPSMSDRQVPIRNNLSSNTRHHELLLNGRATENYQSASPGHLHVAPDRSEMDTQRSFDDDTRSQVRERRSSSRSRRSGTIDTARGHGNTWNNPSSWPSSVPNGFGPFQHGPPVPGFHPAIHQFPWMRPPMDMNHAGVHYPLHGHPESFSQFAQPFPWHNSAEEPYLSGLPVWNANRSVVEEYSDSYGGRDLVKNKDSDLQQQSETEVPLPSHTSDKPSLIQFPAQNQSENSEVKPVDESNAAKADAHAPKYKSERTPGPSNVEVDSRFCSTYFKSIDISTSLASPELYKKCITMVGEFELAESSKFSMHRSLKNNKNEHGYQAEGTKYMVKSMFSGKATSVFENAMALYSSSTGSWKSKTLASSSQQESDKTINQASVNMVEESNVTVAEYQSLPCTDMCDEVHNNDQPHLDAGSAKDCTDTGEDKVGSDLGDKSLGINHSEGHSSDAEELQVLGNGEAQPPQVGSIPDVPKEQVSGVISDTTFPSGSQLREGVNLKRIPCSPGST